MQTRHMQTTTMQKRRMHIGPPSPEFRSYSRLLTLGGVLMVGSLLALRLGLHPLIVVPLATAGVAIGANVMLRLVLSFRR